MQHTATWFPWLIAWSACVLGGLGLVVGADLRRVVADGSHAPADAVELPPRSVSSDHPPEVDRGSPEIMKVTARDDPGQEMIVRAIRGGWCVLVPAGPPVVLVPARGWVWFARPESAATTARVGLYRVSAGGGAISRVAWVPVMPSRLRYRSADIWGEDDAHPRHDLWAEWVSEDRPSEPPTCSGLGSPAELRRARR